MAKNFSNSITQAAKGGGLANLIPTSRKAEQNRDSETQSSVKARKPRFDKDNKNVSTAEKGTKPGEMRKTNSVNMDLAEQIESIAHWDRKSIKKIVNKAFEKFINDYASDSKNKPYVFPNRKIKPISED